jgi:hypothetical protein
MGGEPGGPVVRGEHDGELSYSEWERRVDAMAVLLWGLKGTKKVCTVDEHRRAIESLPPEAYDSMQYYEKWIMALAQCMVRRGLVTSEEIARRMRGAMFRRPHHDMGGLPAGAVKREQDEEHVYSEWERRVDALSVVLGARSLIAVDERRLAIESLPPELYDSLAYYEKWLASMAQTLVSRGVITTEELARKMAEVNQRAADARS